MKLLEFLGFCQHNWKILDKGTIINDRNIRCGNWYVSHCQKCGKIKQSNFTA